MAGERHGHGMLLVNRPLDCSDTQSGKRQDINSINFKYYICVKEQIFFVCDPIVIGTAPYFLMRVGKIQVGAEVI